MKRWSEEFVLEHKAVDQGLLTTSNTSGSISTSAKQYELLKNELTVSFMCFVEDIIFKMLLLFDWGIEFWIIVLK